MGIELTIDTRIIVHSFNVLGIGDAIDIKNARDSVSLQLILLTAFILVRPAGAGVASIQTT
jgi:hypothetical protein